MFRIVYCRLLVYNGSYNTDDWGICYMEEKVKNIKEWVLSHRKVVTTFIITLAVIFMFCSALLFKKIKGSGYEYIEILYYTSQVVSAIFVISGVVIAVWQYYLSYIDSKRNKDLICVQKAVDLSEYYKDNILYYIAPIRYILNNSEISKILSKINKNQIKHFDKKELDLFLSKEDVKKLKRIQKNSKFFNVVIEANLIYNLGLSKDVVKYYKDGKDLSSTDKEILSRFLNKLITRTLNNTEYFALHFTHNVADKTVVYKSLHQTYIDLVQMLYYNIAITNPLSPSKYYTNIIELYEIWNQQSKEDEEIYANGVRNLSDKGTVVENKQ